MEKKNVLDSLRWRYAVKKFDLSREIPDEDWKILESALVLCPSGYGLQPWKFHVIQDQNIRKALTPASLNQSQVQECSRFIVFTTRETVEENYIGEFISQISLIRGVSKDSLSGYYQMMVDDIVKGPKSKFVSEWAARQVYIALGTLITTAAMLGIDACPMEGIVPDKYDDILKLKGTGYRTLVACALGFRSSEDKYSTIKKVRFSKERVIHYV